MLKENKKNIIYVLIVAGLFLRLVLSLNIHIQTYDLNLFKEWANTAGSSLTSVYKGIEPADYPPLYMYVLSIIGKIAQVSYFNNYFEVLLKIPSFLAEGVTSYFIYKLARKNLKESTSLILAAFYLFNPAVIIDSTLWGQVDSVFTLLIVISIYLITEGKIVASSILLSASILMKPQGIIFMPVLFFELVRQKNIRKFIISAVSGIVTAVIIVLPFSISQREPLWIYKLYTSTIGEYPYGSVNAFNFFSLIGGNFKEAKWYNIVGFTCIVLITLVSWVFYIKCNDRKYALVAALVQIAGVFTFSNGMHERYLFPAIAFALLSYILLKDKRFAYLLVGYSITSFANIFVVLFVKNIGVFVAILMGVSVINIGLTIYLLTLLFLIIRENRRQKVKI